MSRLNLVSTDTTTKNKGNQREAAFIDLPCLPFLFPSFPPSLLSPLLLLLLKSTIKNTISNLKHSPCVKLDWNPLLKEITFGAEFLFLQSASAAKEVRKALWRCPLLMLPVWEKLPAFSAQRKTDTFSGANPSEDGQGYIPSRQVQPLGRLPAIRDPL